MNNEEHKNPFSPDYVSQIKPFHKKPQRRPDLKTAPSPHQSLNQEGKQDAQERRWRNMKTSI